MADYFPAVVATEHVIPDGTATPSVSGVTLKPNDLLLLTAQQNPAHNGLWRVGNPDPAVPWNRAASFDSPPEVDPGATFYVCKGAHRGSVWVFVNEARPAAIGVTPLFFEMYLPGAWRPPRRPFSVGLRVSHAGANRLAFAAGALWIPGAGDVVEAPGPWSKDFGPLPPYDDLLSYATYSLYFYRTNDGRLSAELSPERPELSNQPLDLLLKPGDPTRRALDRKRIGVDRQGNINPSTVA